MATSMKERMAQKRKSPEMENEMEDGEMEGNEMPIEGTLSLMTSEMVDHLDNAQMRTLLKQAIEYFQSEKE